MANRRPSRSQDRQPAYTFLTPCAEALCFDAGMANANYWDYWENYRRQTKSVGAEANAGSAVPTRKVYESCVKQGRWKGEADGKSKSSCGGERRVVVWPRDAHPVVTVAPKAKAKDAPPLAAVAPQGAPSTSCKSPKEKRKKSTQALQVEEDSDAQGQVLKRGVSVVAVQKKATNEEIWQAKRYTMREKIMNEVALRLHVTKFDIDVFGTSPTKLCTKFWDRDRCFGQDWGSSGLLWINPPCNDLYDSVRMVKTSGATAVIILPDWPEANWYDLAWSMAVDYYRYDGKKLFEEDQQPEWAVWAMKLDGAKTGLEDVQDDKERKTVMVCELQKKETKSSRRRQRRKPRQ